LETILTLRRDDTSVKIIAMSGTDAELLEIAGLIGADAVIEKPFRAQELLTRVRALAPASAPGA
jgi:DNA-binding response OmpR family regulator